MAYVVDGLWELSAGEPSSKSHVPAVTDPEEMEELSEKLVGIPSQAVVAEKSATGLGRTEAGRATEL